MKASSTRKLSVFFLVGVFYTLCCSNAHAAVQTYPPLTGSDHEQHGSSRYSVHVRPANTSSYRYAYTYRSDNDIEDNPGDCSNPAGGCGPQQHPFSRPIMSNAITGRLLILTTTRLNLKLKPGGARQPATEFSLQTFRSVTYLL